MEAVKRAVKLTVWWGKMCPSTADQAACCFEASILVVTTKTGGMSSGATRSGKRWVNALAVRSRRTDTGPHQEFASAYPKPWNCWFRGHPNRWRTCLVSSKLARGTEGGKRGGRERERTLGLVDIRREGAASRSFGENGGQQSLRWNQVEIRED